MIKLNPKQRELVRLDYFQENLEKLGFKIKHAYLRAPLTNLYTQYYRMLIISKEKGIPNFMGDQIKTLSTLMNSYQDTLATDGWELEWYQLGSTRQHNKGINLFKISFKKNLPQN